MERIVGSFDTLYTVFADFYRGLSVNLAEYISPKSWLLNTVCEVALLCSSLTTMRWSVSMSGQ